MGTLNFPLSVLTESGSALISSKISLVAMLTTKLHIVIFSRRSDY
jgi:hypothetical protein